MGYEGKKILIYGYGNPGRQDDGLGIMLVEKLERWAEKNDLKFMNFDSNYQLNIEDAHTISTYDQVFFVDASIEEDVKDIRLSKVLPTEKTEFTMHAMLPGFILHLCQSLYGKYPETYLLSIKGYEFEFMEEMTARAKENHNKAINLMTRFLSSLSKPDYHSEFIMKGDRPD